MAFLKKRANKGRAGKSKRITSARRSARTPKSARAVDVSNKSVFNNPSVSLISKYFSPSATGSRKAKRRRLKARLRAKAARTIERGIDATAALVTLGQKVAPILLLGGGAIGAISPATVAMGMMGTQAVKATEDLIDHTVKEYNSLRSPTMQKHIDRAAAIMNDGIKTIDFTNNDVRKDDLFVNPFEDMGPKFKRMPGSTQRMSASKRAQEAVELMYDVKKRRGQYRALKGIDELSL